MTNKIKINKVIAMIFCFLWSSFAATIPDDPQFDNQWGVKNTGQEVPQPADDDIIMVPGVPGVDIKLSEAWDITQGSKAIRIGVAETRDIDVFHEDMNNQILRNKDEVQDGTDTDGNGYIDDVYGCDFRNHDGVFNPEVNDHSTHVAGIIGGRINNGKGIAGTAPKAKLVPIISTVRDQSFINGIYYAEDIGIRVINCSQGDKDEDVMQDGLRGAMAEADILFVCSGGNSSSPAYNYPSSYDEPNIISVANIDNTGELWCTSTYGDHVDIAAPGTAILSTSQGGYEYMTGTSQAAPHVAGVAALIMKKYRNLSVSQVVDRIMRSAMRMTTLRGLVKTESMIDAESALRDVGPLKLDATTTPDAVTLFWDRDDKATRYEVEYDGTIVDNDNNTVFVHSGLPTNSGHIYRVRAFYGSKTQPWSHRLFAKAALMPLVEAQSIESPHQYPNKFDSTYTVSKSGASRIRVHFSKFVTLPGDTLEYERYFEYLSDKKIKLSGDYSNGFWTHWIEGDSFSFDFKTDKSKRAYGFKIDRIEYYN